MKFKRPKCLVAERLKEEGLKRPKLLFYPGRGDVFNRIAYKLVKGELGILKEEEFGESILPGKVVGECDGVELLALRGDVKPDSAVVKARGSVDFSGISFNYPTFAVDMSLFDKLLPSERKSLMVQLEIAYGVIKDYLTPENFIVTSAGDEAIKILEEFFYPSVPFQLYSSLPKVENVIVLDPFGDEEFTHEEVTPDTLIVVGGIVDSSERMKGATLQILPNVKHRRITYKGSREIVPDRINEIVKIVCQYLTEDITLEEAVRRNITRDARLRFVRKELQKNLVRFLVNGELLRGIPEELYLKWKEEFELSDFFFRKGAKHVGGFIVFRPSVFDRVIGETKRRKKRVFVLGELKDEDIVAVYP
ncbi:tRNA (guanine-N1)-methyltransferase [Phorcysia thermohydrogeniphila]|uniref:tRNA (Adenine9-N1/guanine9-N1)-methyltransferase n=1 Tax=Phorcysia thermohydrogeniphila TaxID=936138 RepID=A0A4R1GEQ3_9BACT|nr:tRNA (guanine-N1)-methyltransferase [Phorcysia thermohydrogeniphila]TCK05343.1 tRNA (adenine9-N1/guanine9-N1)-methyltransferase [Phorcysia thermohydrogeniphila]